MDRPKDIIKIEILMLDSEKHLLKEAIEKLYKNKDITLLTIKANNGMN